MEIGDWRSHQAFSSLTLMGGWLPRTSVNTGAIVSALTALELNSAIYFGPYLPK